jgi:hypothetical protein
MSNFVERRLCVARLAEQSFRNGLACVEGSNAGREEAVDIFGMHPQTGIVSEEVVAHRKAADDNDIGAAVPFMTSDASLSGRTERIRAPVIRAGPREDREDTLRGQPMVAGLLRARKASGPG